MAALGINMSGYDKPQLRVESRPFEAQPQHVPMSLGKRLNSHIYHDVQQHTHAHTQPHLHVEYICSTLYNQAFYESMCECVVCETLQSTSIFYSLENVKKAFYKCQPFIIDFLPIKSFSGLRRPGDIIR